MRPHYLLFCLLFFHKKGVVWLLSSVRETSFKVTNKKTISAKQSQILKFRELI